MDYILRFEDVWQKYPDKHHKLRTILSGIHLRVKKGEFITIVGPTGCGKSTLLRLILGSEKPYSGRVRFNGGEIKEPGRNRGVVFQNYSLFPDRTVRQNVMFGLELEHFNLFTRLILPNKSILASFRDKADAYLERVGLLEHAEKYPHELSGGMRQRAAIAQAMVMNPRILLLDEPHGALDVGTREEMQIFVLEQWQREKQTVIFVTHDLEEAIFLGSRLIVLSQYYSTNEGGRGIGAKIVKDISIEWSLPRPTEIKHTPEFNQIMKEIRREGLDPTYLQRIEEFDLKHSDSTNSQVE